MLIAHTLVKNPLALTSRTAATYNSSQIQLFRGVDTDAVTTNDTPTEWIYAGFLRSLRCTMMISAATGTARLYCQALRQGQDGTAAYHWINLGDTDVQSATGQFGFYVPAPVPSIIRLQLVIATAAVTADGWIEAGD